MGDAVLLEYIIKGDAGCARPLGVATPKLSRTIGQGDGC